MMELLTSFEWHLADLTGALLNVRVEVAIDNSAALDHQKKKKRDSEHALTTRSKTYPVLNAVR